MCVNFSNLSSFCCRDNWLRWVNLFCLVPVISSLCPFSCLWGTFTFKPVFVLLRFQWEADPLKTSPSWYCDGVCPEGGPPQQSWWQRCWILQLLPALPQHLSSRAALSWATKLRSVSFEADLILQVSSSQLVSVLINPLILSLIIIYILLIKEM